jgi:hypothetical protein
VSTVDVPSHPEPPYEVVMERTEQVLDAVERSLTLLDQHAYGTCGICGEPIDDDRLAADPTATTCAAHLGVAPSGTTPD